MNAVDALSMVREVLQSLRGAGHVWIPIATLDSDLEHLQSTLQADPEGISEAYREILKAQSQAKFGEWEQYRLDAREEYKSAVQAGRYAMNAAMSVNGAASAAILALLGHHVARELDIPGAFRFALLLYLAGVLCGAVAHGITYLTYMAALNQTQASQKRWNLLNRAAIFSVALSLTCFCIGGYLVFVGAL